MNTSSRTVLVTGCSSGIGKATARLLAEKGYHVFASVRSTEDAETLADHDLPTLHPILLDVTSPESVGEAMTRVQTASPHGLCALVNNAGVGLPSAVELTTPEEFQKLLEVNTIAPLRMIRSCLPLLREAEGRIINISSLNGTLASPMAGAYSASKFALVALSNALRVELRPWKVRVCLVAPGQVRTPVFEKAREAISERQEAMPAELRDGYETMYRRAIKMIERGAKSPTSPEDVAAVVHKALTDEHPWPRYRVGFDSRAMRWVQALTPQWVLDRLLARAVGTFSSLK